MQLLSDQGPVSDVSNTQLFMFMYPRVRQETEAAFLIGTYMELVVSEAVTKQKELKVGTLRRVLRARAGYLRSRAVPEICLPHQYVIYVNTKTGEGILILSL